ncbi:hypothetical protein GCM10009645_47520 [Mycolicibacterium poriferae]|uniref:Uncharacterized protein n=1 Tax=Mycolicibacterium poriferae TaxID=39694 RepID=A0A6N4V7A3_9MYCO|nr:MULTISPECIES: hypothetical protein [Mycolicibacterium]MCK5756100.1 hypothetical protein [Mycobacterium sp.]QFS89592.1 hypothetical protein FIV07_02480 [Mycobacterium sp. THAF192]MCG7583742.1 hypothetical protein [Mycolicibacterium sp. OfavD-34-C]MCV7263866.1 hypothetical protein [Mycolicibacterium poriferae]BBX50000.1 hypothetical protein MPOR_10260 [Mycolicibacterium poriferae]
MSRRSDQKKARRKKRRAARDQTWLPEGMGERVAEVVADLEEFDARLTERGWQFNDPEHPDDDVGVSWFWPPSFVDEDGREDDDDAMRATVIALLEDEGGEIAHVLLAGTADDYQFDLGELLENLDVIEGYRAGDPPPVFEQ